MLNPTRNRRWVPRWVEPVRRLGRALGLAVGAPVTPWAWPPSRRFVGCLDRTTPWRPGIKQKIPHHFGRCRTRGSFAKFVWDFGMEHNKSDNKETSSRGADWEVVSLTASAYAASPGPDPEEVVPADNSSNLEGEDESAKAMFMSGHFMFPPNEHESLPLESDISGVAAETIVPDVDPIEIEETVEPIKIQYGNLSTEISPEADEAHGIKFFDKGERVSVHDDDFEDGNQQIFVTESVVPSDQSSSSFPKAIKKSKGKGSGFPSEAWWKKRAASLYAHAKEASTFWSLCVAAAVMGFVIVGQRWQQEKWQIHYLPSRISISDELAGRFLGRFRHFKDALVGGHRRAPILQGAPADI